MGRKRKKTTALLAQLDRAEAVVYALDRGLSVVYCNQACGAWLDIEPAELIGRGCSYTSVDDPPAETLPLAPPPGAWETGQTHVQQMPLGNVPLRVTFHPLRVDGATVAMLAVGLAADAAPPPSDELLSPTAQHERLLKLRGELADRYRIANLLGDSAVMQMVRKQAAIAGDSGANVLLIGEPGSGRQVVARAIHHAGAGGKSSLAQIACQVTGAEMLQAAVKAFLRRREELKEESVGTILLTQVDQLPGDAQHELAGLLSLPEVRLRLIGTSRKPLTELAAESSFGWQLAYRLSTISIRLPSLRERRRDIPLLAQHYLEQAGGDKSTSPHDGFTGEALDLLTAYDWPGNLPQLADAVRQACESSAELLIPAENLPEFLRRAEESAKRTDREWEPIKLDAFLEEIETDLIKEALKHCSGNKTQAAKLLGVSRARLIRRVRQLGLEPGIDFEEIED